MKETLKVLNEWEKQGLYAGYAIGGAMAATFYIEPVRRMISMFLFSCRRMV